MEKAKKNSKEVFQSKLEKQIFWGICGFVVAYAYIICFNAGDYDPVSAGYAFYSLRFFVQCLLPYLFCYTAALMIITSFHTEPAYPYDLYMALSVIFSFNALILIIDTGTYTYTLILILMTAAFLVLVIRRLHFYQVTSHVSEEHIKDTGRIRLLYRALLAVAAGLLTAFVLLILLERQLTLAALIHYIKPLDTDGIAQEEVDQNKMLICNILYKSGIAGIDDNSDTTSMVEDLALYDSASQPASMRKISYRYWSDGSIDNVITTRFSYNADGTPNKISSEKLYGAGITTEYEYDTMGYPTLIKNNRDGIRSLEYRNHYRDGLLVRSDFLSYARVRYAYIFYSKEGLVSRIDLYDTERHNYYLQYDSNRKITAIIRRHYNGTNFWDSTYEIIRNDNGRIDTIRVLDNGDLRSQWNMSYGPSEKLTEEHSADEMTDYYWYYPEE